MGFFSSVEEKATSQTTSVAAGDRCYAILPSADVDEPTELAVLNEIPEDLLEAGRAVWEDDDTPEWNLRQERDLVVPGGTSAAVNTFVRGA